MRRFLVVLPLVAALVCGCGEDKKDKKEGGGNTSAGGGGGGGGGGGSPAAAKKAPPDAWESWNGVGVGTMVEWEMDTNGMKIRTIKTLETKGDPHKLKTEMIMKMGDNETKTPGEEPVPKTKAGATDGTCPLCKKAYKDHKDESKWSEETVKVGDKEVKAMVWEPSDKQCDGSANPSKGTKIWYSNDVPGGMVKMETAQMKMTMTKFEKK